jgi:hypothetical protein
MSKIKYYLPSKLLQNELAEDIEATKKLFDNYSKNSLLAPESDKRYTVPAFQMFDDISTSAKSVDLDTLLNQYQIFEKALDQKYELEGFKNKEQEKDIIKYQLLSLIEQEIFQQLAKTGLPSAQKYIEFASGEIPLQAKKEHLQELLDNFEEERLQHYSPEHKILNISLESLKNLVNKKDGCFANLAIRYNNQEAKEVAKIIDPKGELAKNTTIGQRSWREYFAHIYNDYIKPALKFTGIIRNKNNETNTVTHENISRIDSSANMVEAKNNVEFNKIKLPPVPSYIVEDPNKTRSVNNLPVTKSKNNSQSPKR